ncbi:MAG TPA: VWA domain-containing protein [Propionibacteriaceae bacterium]|nr:VWA domain-containing protein [Propionibacteriaceae bacterium]
MIPMIEFLAPMRLWWLLLIPVIALSYWLLNSRLRPSRRPRTRLDMVIPRDQAWKRHTAVAMALASLAALVLAFSMPKDFTTIPRDRATVVVTIDVSRSMLAEDVDPDRLIAAQEAASAFVQTLPPRFNVALVAFAGTASLIVPPTTDRGIVLQAIDNLEVAPSTAIGEGIYASLRSLRLVPPDPDDPEDIAPAAVVLLSDGATNMGRTSLSAAQEAKKQGVPIYTIAYGTMSGYVVDQGQRMPVPVNRSELATVARVSGGTAFVAESKSELDEVYSEIAQSVGKERVYQEVTEKYAGYALGFAVLAALGVISLGARWP